MTIGKLFLVPTPIGNLKDITLRALEVLKSVDIIAAEDTRQSLKLLNHFEIKKSLISYHQHNEQGKSEEIIDRLNEKSASGIKFMTATQIPPTEPNEKKMPQAMAMIDACRYTIKINYTSVEGLEEEVKALVEKNEWITLKKSKKAEKEVNIKEFIYEFKFWVKDEALVINTVVKSGSREHLSADLLAKYIKEHTSNVDEDAFVDIKREEMYFEKGNKLVPLYNCV